MKHQATAKPQDHKNRTTGINLPTGMGELLDRTGFKRTSRSVAQSSRSALLLPFVECRHSKLEQELASANR